MNEITLKVSQRTFDEIMKRLEDAGLEDRIDDDDGELTIDMSEIVIQAGR